MYRFSVCNLKTTNADCKLHKTVSKNVSQVIFSNCCLHLKSQFEIVIKFFGSELFCKAL